MDDFLLPDNTWAPYMEGVISALATESLSMASENTGRALPEKR